MGVRHQHARPDRDYYVRIIRDRIVTGKESNFDLVPTKYYETLGVPYDVSSVMHYSTTVSYLLDSIYDISKIARSEFSSFLFVQLSCVRFACSRFPCVLL